MKRIAPDKWKHFFVGIGMGAFLQCFFLFFLDLTLVSIILSVGLSAAISYGFELFSLITRKGHYDVMDAVASMAGALIGIGFILLWSVNT